ncbi:hypothetical protein D3C80_2080950 [compost metagenome]
MPSEARCSAVTIAWVSAGSFISTGAYSDSSTLGATPWARAMCSTRFGKSPSRVLRMSLLLVRRVPSIVRSCGMTFGAVPP